MNEPTPLTPSTQEPSTDAVATPAAVPGKGLGIASFIVSLLGFGLIGLVLGLVAKSQSKKAGFGNGFAIAGIVIGILNVLAGLVIAGLIIAGLAAGGNNCTTTSTAVSYSRSCTLNSSPTPATE